MRVSTGYNLGAVRVSTASAIGNAGGTTFPDNTLENSDDYINGRWAILLTAPNAGDIRILSDYTGSTTTVTLRTAATGQIVSGTDYELWAEKYPPALIHDCINRAIRAVPRKAAPPVTSYAFHTGGGIRSFDVATALVGIQQVFNRVEVKSVSILRCDAAFDESVTASVTATLDTQDKREGAGSCRLNVLAAVGTGLLASDSITALDLSGYTHVEFWAKSTVAAAASDLVLRLSATANAASATDDLNLPALVANTWTYVRIALNNPWLDTAIISVGLRQAVDIGAVYLWLDDITAVRDDSEVWSSINRAHRSIDQDKRELVLSELALDAIGYTLLKVKGVKKPTELNADATVCDMEPEYVIAKATALAMRAGGDRLSPSRELAFLEADKWEALARDAMGKILAPQGVEWIDD